MASVKGVVSGFDFYYGRGGARLGFPCIGWDLGGLNFPSGTKGRSAHVFILTRLDVGQKEEREVGLKVFSGQTSKMKPHSLLLLSYAVELPSPCASSVQMKKYIYFLGDRAYFKLVEYYNYYLHNAIKFSNL